jgi:hypothetical protein
MAEFRLGVRVAVLMQINEVTATARMKIKK